MRKPRFEIFKLAKKSSFDILINFFVVELLGDEISSDTNTEEEYDSDEDSDDASDDGDNDFDLEKSINSDESDSLVTKTKRFKYVINGEKKSKKNTNKPKSTINTTSLPVPLNLKSFACPLNILLFHIGHYHHQTHHYSSNQHQMPIYSYHNNYLHHNHYEHLSNLSRSSISLMLLSELVSKNGADFDWTSYLPILLHFCLINFDNTKQLIGEHAKKLLLSLLYVLTIQCELYSLTDYLLIEFNSIVDNQSIIFDRKYTNNNYIDSANPTMNSIYNHSDHIGKLSVGNCHYNYNYNTKVFANFKGSLFSESNQTLPQVASKPRALTLMHSAPVSPSLNKFTSPVSVSSPNSSINIKLTRKTYKIQKAKDHLVVLMGLMSRTKNNPVWPFELISSQNYFKKLTSVQLINEFVSNLKQFLTVCSDSECGPESSLARSNSLNDRVELNLTTVCQKWSQYALNTALNTNTSPLTLWNRHYAGRSLQIYRGLDIKFNSFSSIILLNHRLRDTVADSNEDTQGYVTEMLLTIKMNAGVLAQEYVDAASKSSLATPSPTTTTTSGIEVGHATDKFKTKEAIKQKSKSLQFQKQTKQQLKQDHQVNILLLVPIFDFFKLSGLSFWHFLTS